MKIHHIGLAVRSLESSLAFYRDVLGLAVSGTEDVPAEGVRVTFLPAGEPRIELIEALGANSPIARFVAKRGEGFHHVCFQVADIEASVKTLKARGAEIIEPAIRTGAGGQRIAFIHPRSTHGVLVELREVREWSPS